MFNAHDLSAEIKAARKAADLTLAQLAFRTGIPTRSLARLEVGDPSAPIGRILQVLAALGLGLSIVKTSRPTLEALPSIYADDDPDRSSPASTLKR